jgi:hypothetical protein
LCTSTGMLHLTVAGATVSKLALHGTIQNRSTSSEGGVCAFHDTYLELNPFLLYVAFLIDGGVMSLTWMQCTFLRPERNLESEVQPLNSACCTGCKDALGQVWGILPPPSWSAAAQLGCCVKVSSKTFRSTSSESPTRVVWESHSCRPCFLRTTFFAMAYPWMHLHVGAPR